MERGREWGREGKGGKDGRREREELGIKGAGGRREAGSNISYVHTLHTSPQA